MTFDMRRQASARVRHELRCKRMRCRRQATKRPATSSPDKTARRRSMKGQASEHASAREHAVDKHEDRRGQLAKQP
eukprot:4366513-Alexandrium_andersonii.AAC.1